MITLLGQSNMIFGLTDFFGFKKFVRHKKTEVSVYIGRRRKLISVFILNVFFKYSGLET